MGSNADLELYRSIVQNEPEEVVFVLGGTGMNFWHYLPFLRLFHFSFLEKISGIYGISGGAGTFWLRCLEHFGDFPEKSLDIYDQRMRDNFNQKNLGKRLKAVLTNDYCYHSSQCVDLMSEYVSSKAMKWNFRDFPIRNFNVVMDNLRTDSFTLFSRRTTPDACIAETIAAGAFPDKIRGRKLCDRPHQYQDYSDFDFGSKSTRRKFREYLIKSYPGKRIFFFNLLKDYEVANIQVISIGNALANKFRRPLDFSLAFLGLPNGNYLKAFKGKI